MAQKLSKDMISEIKQLHHNGYSNEKISKKLDISSGSVSKFVRLERKLPISNEKVTQRRMKRIEKNKEFLDKLGKNPKLAKKILISLSEKEWKREEKRERLEKETGMSMTWREFLLLLVEDYSRSHTYK